MQGGNRLTLTELATVLEQSNIPVAYNHFKDAQTLPFICYIDTSTDNLMADNKVHHKTVTVDIELYTEDKDEQLEQTLEQILNDNELPFNCGGSFYIESEHMYQTIYTIKLI